MATIVEQLRELARLGVDVATTDPAATVLVLLGTLVIAFSVGVFGLLTLGAIVGGLGR